MSPRMAFLIKGELLRLNKYRVTTVSLLVAFVWGLVLYFIDDMDILEQMLPMIIMIDATMMSVIFIGSIMFFEKSEQTISTLLVTPTSTDEQILSKVIANTIHMLLSSMLIILVFYFVKGVTVNFFWMIPILIISIAFHSLLGYVFSYHSKDFTSMLLGVMMFIIFLSIPSILHQFNILFKGDFWRYALLITPAQASAELIALGFGGAFTLASAISLVWLIVAGTLGYLFYIKPAYKAYAVRQGGI
ncbi:ABC transporter permease [Paracholeplasma manati]|uniref:ABC transporter permease n=1 Tax=Paracholeplasma manati TaxID=591373 RepID=A0ABT2Y7R9_9MOLU|nr:ABC transporter permease [Paracholeplasma manati]MCV2232790.1 ABC transporter permease [Paracholeplasma manati]MDG0887902.1 ABC transporter permease [Paracholeplasma manati]